ncbi:MAG TPA: TIGR04282 family arsenosugar biosynthesis glycosyltransferase [Pyrinomonadaceae bacterium]|nr:TIGR04282 family arsenosugar biosynthesis glycosyltransferase [Pyrinomonadaceae bacterium]
MKSTRFCALGLMAKAPLAGEVKTRLVPPLTASEAAALNVCFLRDMAENLESVSKTESTSGFVVYTPTGSETAFNGVLPEGFKLLAQRGAHLGERLCNATEDLLQQGYSAVCLINSDSPTLPGSILIQAVESLARGGDRVVLGAAEDGGYYLIGLKHAHRNLFNEIAWSTSDVLARTTQRAAEIDLPVELLPPWYDVDDAKTLDRLGEELFSSSGLHDAYPAPHTRAFLEAIIEKEGPERICPNYKPRTNTDEHGQD